MSGIYRACTIERDAHGARRMIYRGDYRTVPVVHETCPHCLSGPRLLNGKCPRCWRDFSGETRTERV